MENKNYNGFENQREYDFFNNLVQEVTSDYPMVHTTWVGVTNGTIDVMLNDVKIEFYDPLIYQPKFTRRPTRKSFLQEFFVVQMKKICDKEFK